MSIRLLGVSLVLASFSLVGCNSNPAPENKAVVKKSDDDHDHGATGPHGGVILELGKYHGEFTVNHDTKEVTFYLLNGNLKKAVPIDADKLLLIIKKPAFQVDLLPSPETNDPKGSSSRFVAKHDNFGVKQAFAGTVSGEITGKPFKADFEEKE